MTHVLRVMFYVPHSPIAHGPGPPQRPHIGLSGAEVFFDPSDETANTLSARAVWGESHFGQLTFSDEVMVRTSFSKFAPQDLHWYS
jgi:hypothetical protein